MKLAKRMFYQSFNNIGGSTNMLQIPYLYAELNVSFHIQYVINSVSIPYLICGIKTYVSVCCKFRTLFRILYTESKRTFSVLLLVCCNSVPYTRNQKVCYKFRTLYAESKSMLQIP